ncbi:N-acetylmuramoyl-L-alanine amidase CwlD [Amphibacillus sp. MSJ-3]|uniref:N-acetylmuramoyl-L-alanine amidase CwlD n=1 Tax=Amphibacillus sp. MSJ-3 TaxID=2841505 RepID=UPI001C0F070A|nr:N-acetylmuramoyl-L-alanine amidase CwlD [Amphibacillus sp. MSJ-3]MBU5595078.1 N-acetylmuramoyl-L-alanine amidase CwlD [Amphibacillus sp. MSJ-3]
MPRIMKLIIWIAGFILLIVLMRSPIEQTTNSTESLILPLSGKVIVLDPGHGGADGGAVGADQTLEKELALTVSKKLQHYLQQAGAEVYLTRETDRDLANDQTKGVSQRKVEDIKNRVVFMEEKDPDIFITLHLNALPSTQWRGAQTFYHPNQPSSKILAETIQEEIKVNLGNTNREALAINSVYVLKHANRPAALVEIGFLSNPDERELLKQSIYQNKMAASIYYGILSYFSESFN